MTSEEEDGGDTGSTRSLACPPGSRISVTFLSSLSLGNFAPGRRVRPQTAVFRLKLWRNREGCERLQWPRGIEGAGSFRSS